MARIGAEIWRGRIEGMKSENKKQILVSSPLITELLKKMIKQGIEEFPKVSVPNLSDYFIKFENIK